MDGATVASLFATAIIIGAVGVVAAIVWEPARLVLQRFALPIAGAVATSAMLGSLYFSDVADFVPCKLCWYQRIAMYPLAVLLVMGAIRRDRSILRYVRVVAAMGVAVSAYHVWIQWFPEKSNFCEFDNPCSAKWVEAFGQFTIPQMAGLSFLLIIATATFGLRAESADL